MQRSALVSSRKKAFRKSALLQTLNTGQVSSIQAKTALLKTNQDIKDLYDTLDTSALIWLWYRHRFSSLGLYLQALLGGKAGFYLPRSPPQVVERSEVHFRAEFYWGECLFSAYFLWKARAIQLLEQVLEVCLDSVWIEWHVDETYSQSFKDELTNR